MWTATACTSAAPSPPRTARAWSGCAATSPAPRCPTRAWTCAPTAGPASRTTTGTVRVQLALRRPDPDGTTHLIFEPLQFIEKLAALVGPPRANLLHYHGYLAPCASWRDKIVPAPPEPEPATHIQPLERFGQPPPLPPRPTGTRWFPWALLLWRSLQIDALLCPRCGSRMKILAYLTDPPVVEAVLDALELPSQAPTVSPARSQLQLEYCQAPPGPRPARMVCALGAQGKMAGRRPPEPGQ